MTEPLIVDVYYSFRSPYCYLAAPRLLALQEKYNVQVRLKPVLPLVVRKPEFFQKANPQMVKYHNADFHRVAEFLGIPINRHWAEPDPVVIDLVDGVQTMSPEQPYIHRLTYLGALAEERGRGIHFACQVSSLVWNTENWNEGDLLAQAVAGAGLNLEDMDLVTSRDPTRLQTVVDRNEKALSEAGHWGVPAMVFQNEPFFGQDRLELLVWRMKQQGLRARAIPEYQI